MKALADTGGLLYFELGGKKSAELPLFRKWREVFGEGDTFLGDKGFCSCYEEARRGLG